MAMELSDFKRKGKGISNIIPIEGRNLTILIRKEDDQDFFKILGYGYHVKIKHIVSKDTLEEVDEVVMDICKKLESACYVTDKWDMSTFLEKLSLEYPKQQNRTRLRLTSNDGKITMFIKEEKNGFVCKVRDYKEGTTELKEAYIHYAVATEEEAERILTERMNEYDCFGYYSRILKRKPKYHTQHEKNVIDDCVNFVIENISSEEEYEFLLKQQEMFKDIKGV